MKGKLIQADYIGENRCTPCTVLNVAIALLVGAVVSKKSKYVGYISLVASLVVIYFRGYLIPGTPSLTKRYLPGKLLEMFGKEPTQASGGIGHVEGLNLSDSSVDTGKPGSGKMSRESSEHPDIPSMNVSSYLVEVDVLEPCPDHNDLCVTDKFESGWSNEIEELLDEDIVPRTIIDLFGLEGTSEDYIVETHAEAWSLYQNDGIAGQWPSRLALVIDLASASILSRRDSNWTKRSPKEKGEVLSSVRIFLNRCPNNEGTVQFKEELVESCCQSHEVLAAECSNSGERVFEHSTDNLTY